MRAGLETVWVWMTSIAVSPILKVAVTMQKPDRQNIQRIAMMISMYTYSYRYLHSTYHIINTFLSIHLPLKKTPKMLGINTSSNQKKIPHNRTESAQHQYYTPLTSLLSRLLVVFAPSAPAEIPVSTNPLRNRPMSPLMTDSMTAGRTRFFLIQWC